MTMMKISTSARTTLLICGLLFSISGGEAGREYYVAANGSPSSGAGTRENPWSLAMALAHPAAVQPGDTIWVRGGLYEGRFASQLRGTEGSPILVRAYPGERATIVAAPKSGGEAAGALEVKGAWTWYWGLEITSRPGGAGLPSSDSLPGRGVRVEAEGVRFINLAVHGTSQAFSIEPGARQVELYGNAIYENGGEGPGIAAPGIHLAPGSGPVRLVANVIFRQRGTGIRATGGSQLHLEENAVFDNGPGARSVADNIDWNGARLTALRNRTYAPVSARYAGSRFAASEGVNCEASREDGGTGSVVGGGDLTMEGNYFADGAILPWDACEGRQFSGSANVVWTSGPASNASLPAQDAVYLTPNAYESNRALLTVYNWERAATVRFDAGDFLAAGQSYEIREAGAPFGHPLVAGVHDGGPLLTVQLPAVPAAAAVPEFHAFLLTKVAPTPQKDQAGGAPVTRMAGTVPTQDLKLWLKADTGVTQTAGKVSQWADQSGSGTNAVQADAANQPAFLGSAFHGLPALEFDGVNDFLTFNQPLNGLSQLTLVLVSASMSPVQDGSWNGATHSPLFWNESAAWSTVQLSPYQQVVKLRFGTGAVNNLPAYTRPASIGANPSITMAIKNGATETLYVDGAQVLTANDKRTTIQGVQPAGNLGRGYNNNTYFTGRIAEVLVYTRALTEAERQALQQYLNDKYILATPVNQAPVVNAGPDVATTLANAASLNGTASDDGLPSGTLSTTWSKVSGPGTVQFANGSSASTTATFSAAGVYTLRLTASDGLLSHLDDVVVTVTATEPPPGPGSIPQTGLQLWLKADEGVTLASGKVSQWTDQSGNGTHAAQLAAASQPAYVAAAFGGRPALEFDGVNDFLNFNLPLNGLNGMTIVLVSASTSQSQDGSWHGATHSPIFWNETTAWSTVNLGAYQNVVKFRFGTRQVNNLPSYTRPASIGANHTITLAMKDAATETLYVDGSLVLTQGGKVATLQGVQPTGNLGRGYNNNTYFAGRIAEVLVYTRALSEAERQALQQYLVAKYPTTVVPPPVNQAPVVNGGPDQTIALANAASLNGTATDDGLPAGTLSVNWSKVSGPGLVTFSSAGAATTMATFSVAGSYVLRLSASDGLLTSSDDVNVFVDAPQPPGSIPVTGLRLWLRADQGVTQTAGGVSQWEDQSGNGTHAVQQASASRPAVSPSAINGKPALQFDGVNDFLTFNLPLNGLSALTLVLVSSSAQDLDGSSNGATNAPLFWNETAGWSTVHLSPFQKVVKLRFGTLQINNLPSYSRITPVSNTFGLTMAIKNGSDEKLYIDGKQVLNTAGKLPVLNGVSPTGNLGRGYNNNTYFPGRIAEVLVYNRALTDAERLQLQRYLGTKYYSSQPPVAVNNGYSTAQSQPLTVSATGGVLANDTDLTGDTLQAVLVGNVSHGSLSLNADGSFTYTPNPTFHGTDSFTYRATDGALQSNSATVTIAVTGTTGGNQPPKIVTGAPSFTKSILGTGLLQTHSVVSADFNGDGRLDAAATDYLGSRVVWYENTGSAGFTARVVDPSLTGAYPLHAGDVDRDGRMDLLAGAYQGHLYVWYRNNGNGTFTRNVIDTPRGPHSLVTFDLDRDGDIDLVAANQDAGTIGWYENNGANSFTWRLVDGSATQAKRAEPADLDGDGDADIVAASFQIKEIAWYENNGSQQFLKRVIDIAANGAYYVFPADVDGDHDMDILATSQVDGIVLYRNIGLGSFQKQVIDAAAPGARTVIAADVDGDGDVDAIAASVDNDTVAWYRNDGSGNFLRQVVDPAADGAYSVFAIDFDRDGDTDILSASRDANAAAIHWQVRAHSAQVARGGSLAINSALLRTVDVDDAPSELTYTLTQAPAYGEVRLDGASLAAGGSFKQSDVDRNAVSYRHGGSAGPAQDSFAFVVADGGENGVTPAAGRFVVSVVQ